MKNKKFLLSPFRFPYTKQYSYNIYTRIWSESTQERLRRFLYLSLKFWHGFYLNCNKSGVMRRMKKELGSIINCGLWKAPWLVVLIYTTLSISFRLSFFLSFFSQHLTIIIHNNYFPGPVHFHLICDSFTQNTIK